VKLVLTRHVLPLKTLHLKRLVLAQSLLPYTQEGA
tara:strand:- start:13 stop:117 length:105 start_codon:yes stop_codon:yes gene_type:complete